jgi:hypothetical protein
MAGCKCSLGCQIDAKTLCPYPLSSVAAQSSVIPWSPQKSLTLAIFGRPLSKPNASCFGSLGVSIYGLWQLSISISDLEFWKVLRKRSAHLVNDHSVLISMMTEPYFWHYHPNSDDTFIVGRGHPDRRSRRQTIELHAGQIATITKGVIHRTQTSRIPGR